MKKIILKAVAFTLFALIPMTALPTPKSDDFYIRPRTVSPVEAVLGLALLVGIGILGYKCLKLFFNQKPTVSPYLNANVNVGKSVCIGREQSIIPGSSRKVIVKVKNQFDSDGGGSASCAYHTVKNFIQTCNALGDNSTTLQQDFLDPKVVQTYFGPSGSWRTFIKNKDKGRGDGEWAINVGDILAFEKRQSSLAKKSLPYHFTVIDTIELVGLKDTLHKEHADKETRDPYEGLACPVTLAVQQALFSKGDYVHGFAIQTASQGEENTKWESLRSRSGHWKLLVFHKHNDGRREYILCDSTNGSKLNDPYAEKIINVIENLALDLKP